MKKHIKSGCILCCSFVVLACGDKATSAVKKNNTSTPFTKDAAETDDTAGDENAFRENNKWIPLKGGTFIMGSNKGGRDNRPVHPVTLSDFSIQKTEVTVAQYTKCIQAKKCTVPKASYEDDLCNLEDDKKDREHHPVNCVSWRQAREYCKWIGGALPTEAQWEYAARSQGKDVIYPWGNEPAGCKYAVVALPHKQYELDDKHYACGLGHTWPVCSKQKGNTAQGLCDMAGNAWEWVEDTYDPNWYSQNRTAQKDPCNRADGLDRVLRGGNFFDDGTFSTNTRRGFSYVKHTDHQVGFRCVKQP